MTKSKNFWAAAASACLILSGVSGYSIYNRLAVHFLNDTVEIRPRPVPVPRGEEVKEEPADRPEAKPDQKAGTRDEKEFSGKSPRAAAEPDGREEPGRQRAVKTFFEYRSAAAKSVRLAGSFSKWNEIRMARKNGVWKAEVFILPGNYLYHFVADGRKVPDPGKPKTPLGESLLEVEEGKPKN